MDKNKPPRSKASLPVRLLISALCLLTILAIVGVGVFATVLSTTGLNQEDSSNWMIGVAFMLVGVVGTLAAMGQPYNPVGWILLLGALSISLAGFGGTLATFVREVILEPGWATVIDWLSGLAWYTGLLLVFAIFPFLFPSGRLPEGRIWRPIFWLTSFYAAGIFTSVLISGLVLLAMEASLDKMTDILQIIETTFVVFPLLLALGLASLVVRYRQSQSDVRRQMKWLILTFILSFSLLALLGMLQKLDIDAVSNFLYGIAYLMIPVGLGIALLRYKMFDVDSLIRRGTSYAILTFMLALLYFGLITLLQSLSTSVFGLRSPVVIVLSTLAIAALFNPLRRRIQDFIDRRFYRRKYDAEKALAQFAMAARNETDIQCLNEALLEVVQETVQPESVSIWLRKGMSRR